MPDQLATFSVSISIETDQTNGSTSHKSTTSKPYWRNTAWQTAIQHVHLFQAVFDQWQQRKRSLPRQRTYRSHKSQELYSTRQPSHDRTYPLLRLFSADSSPSG